MSNEDCGYYWTSSASSPANGQGSGAWSFYFKEDGILINDFSDFRYRGTAIRAVSDKDTKVDPNPEPTPDPQPSITKEYNGHELVDLGLPSGLYWATCNVGAENEIDNGDYYAWGEIEAKSQYTSSNYIGYRSQ